VRKGELYIGCNERGHAAAREVRSVAEDCLQQRESAKRADEGPDVYDQ